jgi:hypothetical protein
MAPMVEQMVALHMKSPLDEVVAEEVRRSTSIRQGRIRDILRHGEERTKVETHFGIVIVDNENDSMNIYLFLDI